MTLAAGTLRHRVDIERREDIQDPTTGAVSPRWTLEHTRVPASVEPLSAREFIAAQALQSQISMRITIRVLPNVTASHRVRHGTTLYNIEGPPLRDKDSGQEYLTLLVSEVAEAYESPAHEVIVPAVGSADTESITADTTNITADAA